MPKILIYSDNGADSVSVQSTIAALNQENLHLNHEILSIDRHYFKNLVWQDNVSLLIFPGGRDIPYHRALKGEANQSIIDYVKNGGRFLGLCAGGYYGSAEIEFEKGHVLEVCQERELRFFSGIARGPIYGLGQFCYRSENGSKIAHLTLSHSALSVAAYYKGGCAFIDADRFPHVSVLARYSDIENTPPAVVRCQIGEGVAVLCGVHPEYSSSFSGPISEPLFSELKGIEEQRRLLFREILTALKF